SVHSSPLTQIPIQHHPNILNLIHTLLLLPFLLPTLLLQKPLRHNLTSRTLPRRNTPSIRPYHLRPCSFHRPNPFLYPRPENTLHISPIRLIPLQSTFHRFHHKRLTNIRYPA